MQTSPPTCVLHSNTQKANNMSISVGYDLTPEAALDRMMEECAEVIQAISKYKRFGAESSYVERRHGPITNKEHLELELADILSGIELLHELGVIDKRAVENEARFKTKYFKTKNAIPHLDLPGHMEDEASMLRSVRQKIFEQFHRDGTRK